jgi:HPt (histidine-containing phosphotransfer) domain-containing protein
MEHLPVIAMTANAMVGDREKAIDAGMNDHVAKPIRVDDLFATLQRWLAPHKPPAAEQPAAAVDRGLGLQNAGGSEALYQRLLTMFVERAGNFPERLAAALHADDHDGATRLAHDLKCEAGTLGVPALERTAAALEHACTARNAAEIERLAAQVATALPPVIVELRQLLQLP